MMRPHNNFFWRSSSSRAYVTIVILFIILIGILLFPPARSFVGNVVYRGAVSLWSVGGSVKNAVSVFFAAVSSKVSLEEEVKLLREENMGMQAQMLDRNLLFEEVAKLEEVSGRSKSDNRIYARVLGAIGHSPYDTFLVDVGTDHGVVASNRVVYTGSGMVGEVIEASAQFSKIRLHSSPGLEQEAIIVSTKTPITAQGRGMGNFEARVPEGVLVTIGDMITSAKGEFILGRVVAVDRRPAEPFARIFFRVPFNINEVRSVEIIKNI